MNRRLSRFPQIAAVAALIQACATLPPDPAREASVAAAATAAGTLAAAEASINPPLASGQSAFYLLPAARDALAWRLALIDSAERAIDAQYFVWHDDAVGSLLMERLFAAADRGVRVRLLVDDLHLVSARTMKDNDRELAAVDAHPNLELRLFNPGKYRSGTVGVAASLGIDTVRYNRRMHNKMLQVDGHFAIVGGRNIGDEYFGLDEEFNFVDLDVLVTGAALPQLETAFDEYWNAELSYPAGALAEVDEDDYREMRRDNREYTEQQAGRLSEFQAIDPTRMLEDTLGQLRRGTGTFFRDDPVEPGEDETRLYETISVVPPAGGKELLASTPYLIPTASFLKFMEEDARTGMRIRLLTNSLATNNQPAVHSHYEKYRKVFLDMGLELFELHHRPEGRLRERVDTPPVRADHLALHMKASVLDGKTCFVGTLNFDPRSININTEDVLYIESPGLCGDLRSYLASIMTPEASWSLSRNQDDKLQWTSFEGTVHRQPALSVTQRLMDAIYRLLPEGQL